MTFILRANYRYNTLYDIIIPERKVPITIVKLRLKGIKLFAIQYGV